MSKPIKLARCDDVVEGTPVAVEVPDLPPLAVFRFGDDFYVTSNLCTHGTAMLTDGYQDGPMIECSIHGGAFDIRTGEAKVFPCKLPLRAFKVTVEDGYVCVDG
ncbi:MAG: non-heme iron oxygenase ferredoxin subunit [Panacagrimonas sp.]